MALKTCKMWSKWRWNSYFLSKKQKNRPTIVVLPPDLHLYEMTELHHFAQLATRSRHFWNKKILTLKPPSLEKSWLHACLWMCRGIDILLVDWKLAVLSFLSSRFICAANMSTAWLFSSQFIHAVNMSKWSNQICRIRVMAKNLRNKTKRFFFNALLVFFARTFLVYKKESIVGMGVGAQNDLGGYQSFARKLTWKLPDKSIALKVIS